MIYLASPYSHPAEHIRIRRYLAARDFCHAEMQKGRVIFSPIAYGHQFARDLGFPGDHNTWLEFNNEMMLLASSFWVLQLDGWKESLGISHEITRAIAIGLSIEHKDPLPYAPL